MYQRVSEDKYIVSYSGKVPLRGRHHQLFIHPYDIDRNSEDLIRRCLQCALYPQHHLFNHWCSKIHNAVNSAEVFEKLFHCSTVYFMERQILEEHEEKMESWIELILNNMGESDVTPEEASLTVYSYVEWLSKMLHHQRSVSLEEVTGMMLMLTDRSGS